MSNFTHDDNGRDLMPRGQRLKVLGAGAVLMVLIGLVLLFIPRLAEMPPMNAVVIGMLLLFPIIALSVLIVTSSQKATVEEKQKRGLYGRDIYSIIDRMVDELDDNEMEYLRSRLEQREHGSKHELTNSLDELLSQREEKRETNGG